MQDRASRRSRRRVGRATRAIFRPASPSQWDLAKLPLGGADAPTRSPSGSFARSQWDLRKSQWEKIKSHWEGETGRVGVAKRASKSEWERRGGPRRVPLGPPTGRRATTVRAPISGVPSYHPGCGTFAKRQPERADAASCAALCRGNAVEAIGAATHLRLLCAAQQLGLDPHSAADAYVCTYVCNAGSIKTGYDTVRYAMGMTDKVVGTGMLSFITLGGKDTSVDPKEPAHEQPPRAPQQDGQPAEKQ